ncbi:MAG: molybdopterin cofactor-binding domain-containing protein [Hyphomicrobium sp.]
MIDRKDTPAVFNVSRRAVTFGFGAGALVLATGLADVAFAEEKPAEPKAEPKWGGDAMPNGLRDDPTLFVSIAEDGTVSIVCIRSEMGQGVRTSVPMIVADELEADWAKVKIVQAPGDEVKYGNQDTDGSRSIRHHFMPLRRIGAAARQMLEAAAAAQWGVPVGEVEAINHEVVHKPSGKKLGYGALAKAAAAQKVPASDALKLKDPAKFRYIGKGKTNLVDNMDITTGKAQYGTDVRLAGMTYAVIARPPVYGGKVIEFDAAEAMKVPGALKVIALDPPAFPTEFQNLGGIAVIATNTWAALQARDKLKIKWDHGPNATYTTAAYRKALEETSRKPGKVELQAGDVDAAMKTAKKKVEAEYYIPHHSHVSMEPPVAVAQIANGKCEIWSSIQSPQAAKDRVSKRLGIKLDDVTVHVTLLGGAFGRKSKPDFCIEAALCSKAMDGKPVQLLWTREDDLVNGYLNTTSVERIEAGLDDAGKPVAWLHRSTAPSILSLFAPDPKHQFPLELGLGLVDTPFDIPNMRIETGEAAAHTRVGWFRSVTNVPHAFALQSFIAELATAAGKDHKDFLLDVIGPDRKIIPKTNEPWWNYGENHETYAIDTARLKRVIETVTKEAGWGRKMPAGSGLGLAAHRAFVSYAAAVVEVVIGEGGRIKIPRVDLAIDCGAHINPERIRSQLEGAIIQGISIAMYSNITFKDGVVEQKNFDSYELARMDIAPREVRIHLVPSTGYDAPLGGVGEPGVPPIAPAIANAIFAATGKRLRSLPIGGQLAS